MTIYRCSGDRCPPGIESESCPWFYGVEPTHLGKRGKDWATGGTPRSIVHVITYCRFKHDTVRLYKIGDTT